MNQRILSCPSSLLTKGLTLKASDWSALDAATSNLDILRKPNSVASMPNNWKATSSSSSSSFSKHSDLRHTSSSSLASIQTNDSFKQFQSPSAMGNATWDGKMDSTMTLKQTTTRRPSLLDLVSLKTDDPFKKHGMSRTNQGYKSTNNMFLAGKATNHSDGKSVSLSRGSSSTNNVFPTGNATARRTCSNSISLCLPGSLEKVDESLKCSFTSTARNATWDNNLSVTASITYSSPSSDDFSEFIAKSFAEKPRKQVDILRISTFDLASLNKNDAFMYYSIPSLRSAMWRDEDVDILTMQDAAFACKIPSSYARKSCISVESCHVPDLASTDVNGMDIGLLTVSDGFYNMSIDEQALFLDDDDDWLISLSEEPRE